MEMNEYPSNSDFGQNGERPRRAMTERPKAERVAKGSVVVKEKSYFRKMVDTFFNTENIPNVKDYIIFDVMIPGARRMVLESIESFFGVRSGTIQNAFGKPHTQYNKPPASQMNGNAKKRATYEYSEIYFESAEDAMDVLEACRGDVNEFGNVSVNDFFDHAGYQGPPQSTYYGWFDLRPARVESMWLDNEIKYVIRMPKALPLN